MVGFIKIDRRITEWEWHSDPFMMSLWIHLLVYANFEDRRWLGTELKRGQVSISVKSLAAHIGLTPKQLRLRLAKLQRTGEIVVKGTNRNTIITICKYDLYQSRNSPEGQTKGTQRALKGRTKDEQRTTNKEVKNSKNDNSDIDLLFDNKLSHNKSLSVDDAERERARFIEFLFFERELTASAAVREAERFVANYERTGWLDRNGHQVRNRLAALKLWETKKDTPTRQNSSEIAAWRTIYDCAPDIVMIRGFYGFCVEKYRFEESEEWEDVLWLVVSPALKKYLQSERVRPLVAPALEKLAAGKRIMIRTKTCAV